MQNDPLERKVGKQTGKNTKIKNKNKQTKHLAGNCHKQEYKDRKTAGLLEKNRNPNMRLRHFPVSHYCVQKLSKKKKKLGLYWLNLVFSDVFSFCSLL
jgi:hypothetical protein